MRQFNYEYDIEKSITKRTPGVNYPAINDIITSISNGDPIGAIMTRAQLAAQGVVEEPIITIENSWWEQQSTIQDLDVVVANLDALVATTVTDRMGVVTDLTQEELDANKLELDALINSYNLTTEQEVRDLLAANLKTATDARVVIETASFATVVNEWLTSYRGLTTTATRPVVTGVIPKYIKKLIAAREIEYHVRNKDDTIADLAKMVSLLLSMVSSIYGTLSTTQKGKIPAAERAIIDYATTTFAAIQTRADRQLATEGTTLIDKLFGREVEIADIVGLLVK